MISQKDSILDNIHPINEPFLTITPDELKLWLRETPKLTTYRINLLKYNATNIIQIFTDYFNKSQPTTSKPPKIFEIFSDTIGIECWPFDHSTSLRIRPEVIVDAFCGCAVLRGSHVFAPGVLGLPSNINLDEEVNIFADLSGHCKRGLKISYSNGIKCFVGVGKLKQLRYEIFGDKLSPKGIAVETIMPYSKVPVIDNSILPPGSCLLQNLPSIICSKVLNPQRGEIILDMCASPGNKTSHIAEIIRNNGIIIALDKSETKINQIKKRCTEGFITCVHAFICDSTKAVCTDTNGKVDLLLGPPFLTNTFDRVLLDAPCSALGQRPVLKNTSSIKTLKSYVPLQRKLFHAAILLLKIDGYMVYSTCTTTMDECESMVIWALKTFPNISLISAEPLLGGPGWKNSGLTDEQRFKVQRFGPEKDNLRIVGDIYNDTIGFFIAKFKKNA